MFDAVMWWTGVTVWVVCGGAGIACGLGLLAHWACAYVSFKWRITSDFVRYVIQRREGFSG